MPKFLTLASNVLTILNFLSTYSYYLNFMVVIKKFSKPFFSTLANYNTFYL